MIRTSESGPTNGCAEQAERLCTRLAELRWCLGRESLERCADLATQAVESKDYAGLVDTQGLMPGHVETLEWAETVLHEALVHGDGHRPVNFVLAESLGFSLGKVEDWLHRLAGQESAGSGAWVAQPAQVLDRATPLPL